MGYYKQDDGLKYYLERRYIDRHKKQFPYENVNYVDRYRKIEEKMNDEFHPNVVLGAALSGDGLLTDHGIEHIKMVIRNASMLLQKKISSLKGYEIYILLLAIHFHDVGNTSGREDHEKKIDDIMEKLDKGLLDVPEKAVISNIATAHGGKIEGSDDRDTLRNVNSLEICNGISIRSTLLAAVLRFADELAEDKSRANRYLYDAGQIPEANRIFHEYSLVLDPISIMGNTIRFIYHVPFEKTLSRIPNDKGTYLYDEIRKRLKKCMCELEYCRKYAEGYIEISALSADVNIMKKNMQHRIERSIKLNLRLSGYPGDYDSINIEPCDIETGEELKSAMESM